MSCPYRPTLIDAVREIIAQFLALELHAARAGREVMRVLVETARCSSASETTALAADIRFAADAILRVMPPYAPALNVLHRILARVEEALRADERADALRIALAEQANAYQRWSAGARARIAAYGTNVIPEGGTVFTYTLSETALSCFRFASESGKRFRLVVTESRPNNDGLDTAQALFEAGLDVDVSIDACVARLLPRADVMMIGAEAITADGSAIAKVGTYPSALVARQFAVPCYVVVDSMKLDVSSTLGLPLALDALQRTDALPAKSPDAVSVAGSLFDRTPGQLIRGVVSERGILTTGACSALMREMPVSQYLQDKLTKAKS